MLPIVTFLLTIALVVGVVFLIYQALRPPTDLAEGLEPDLGSRPSPRPKKEKNKKKKKQDAIPQVRQAPRSVFV